MGQWLRRWGYRAYFRLVRVNYEKRLYARPNRTPIATFRSYDLINRHGSDRMLEALRNHCHSDAIVYDIGANVGIYSLAIAMAEPACRVLAFEPAPTTVEHFRANLARNALDDRVDLYPCGIGAKNEQRQFYVSTFPELSGFDRESATRWGATVADTTLVRVQRLDDIIETAPPPDVIKLDVEGAGPAVLEGGHRTLDSERPVIIIEPHTTGLSEDPETTMRKQLEEHGYQIYDHGEYWSCLPEYESDY